MGPGEDASNGLAREIGRVLRVVGFVFQGLLFFLKCAEVGIQKFVFDVGWDVVSKKHSQLGFYVPLLGVR